MKIKSKKYEVMGLVAQHFPTNHLKILAFTLASCTDYHGRYIHLPIDTLAQKTRMKIPTIKRQLAQLQEVGVIEQEDLSNHLNVVAYRINPRWIEAAILKETFAKANIKAPESSKPSNWFNPDLQLPNPGGTHVN